MGVKPGELPVNGRATGRAVGVDSVDGDHAGEEVCGEEKVARLVGGHVAGVGLQLDLSDLGHAARRRVDSEAEDSAVAVVPHLLIEESEVGGDAQLPGLGREVDIVLEGELSGLAVHREHEEPLLLGERDVDEALLVRPRHRTVKE